MSLITKSAPLVALTVFVSLAPAAAQAQDQRLRVSFAPAVATQHGDTSLALGGTVGYRFLDRLWFEGEFTWIDAGSTGFGNRVFNFDPRAVNTTGINNLIQTQFGGGRNSFVGAVTPGRPNLPTLPVFPIDIAPIRATTDGSTIIGTMGVRYEFPAQSARFRPYVAAGLGLHNTDQKFQLAQTMLTPAFSQSGSYTGFALSAGGGASVRLAGQLWADGDVKYFRLSNNRDIMRLGGGVSYRF
jgi:opacity protein-like surface antigen